MHACLRDRKRGHEFRCFTKQSTVPENYRKWGTQRERKVVRVYFNCNNLPKEKTCLKSLIHNSVMSNSGQNNRLNSVHNVYVCVYICIKVTVPSPHESFWGFFCWKLNEILARRYEIIMNCRSRFSNAWRVSTWFFYSIPHSRSSGFFLVLFLLFVIQKLKPVPPRHTFTTQNTSETILQHLRRFKNFIVESLSACSL